MNQAKKQKYSYLFVVTYGRSGSTLLQKILQSIPGFFIRGENEMAVLPLMNAFKRAKLAHKEFGNRKLAADNPWFGADDINPDRYAEKLRDVFVDEIIQPPSDARVVGFKEIRWYSVQPGLFELLDFLRAHFSPCKFVFNIRAVDDVAKSSFWKKRDKNQVLGIVHSQNALYRAYSEMHPESCFIVDYDRYISDLSHIEELFRFLDEPFDREQINSILRKKLKH